MATGERRNVQTVGELRAALEGLDDNMVVTFQNSDDWDGAEALGGLEVKKDDDGLATVVMAGAGWFVRLENEDGNEDGNGGNDNEEEG